MLTRQKLLVAIMLSILLQLSIVCAQEKSVQESVTEEPTMPSAGSLILTKEAPSNVTLGNTFEVIITITNTQDREIEVTLHEAVTNAEAIGQTLTRYATAGDVYAARPPELQWTVNVGPRGRETVRYTLRPVTVGRLSIGPTRGIVDGNEIFSNPVAVSVLCLPYEGRACDPAVGENYLTCPSKCTAPTPEQQMPPPLEEAEESEGVPSWLLSSFGIIGGLGVLGGIAYWLMRKKGMASVPALPSTPVLPPVRQRKKKK